MALRPTPAAVVVVRPDAPSEAVPLTAFQTAPIRPVTDDDYMLVLDPLGAPARVPWSTVSVAPSEPEIPDNAFVDEFGAYIVDEFGAYFTM
jgi:hypothetical protein